MTMSIGIQSISIGFDEGSNAVAVVGKEASKIKWKRFKVKKSFPSIIKGLISKQPVTDHGKSGRVASLTKAGVDLAYYLKTKNLEK